MGPTTGAFRAPVVRDHLVVVEPVLNRTERESHVSHTDGSEHPDYQEC
jgi:hypothetical protein